MRGAADLGKQHYEDGRNSDKQRGLAVHHHQNAPAKERRHQQISHRRKKQFHVSMVATWLRCASKQKAWLLAVSGRYFAPTAA